MERDRAFNFKLLVPPRVSAGQVSAVRPQEAVEKCGDFMNTLQQEYSTYFDKGQKMAFPDTSMVTPTKPTRQDFYKMKVVPPLEKDEDKSNPGQLYTKLLDEVDKIKDWKVKVDSDTVQKEKRLQENKRTIETQRKAIQDLQKLIGVFENLCIRVEADQQELHKVKEGLLQFEELKVKYCQEYNMKEEEVAELQTQLKNKENEVQKILLDLKEAQQQGKQLQEATNQQNELLKSSAAELKSLLQKLQTAEHQREETQKNHEATAAALKQSKDECAQIIQSKDLSLQELETVKIQQAEKLEKIQTTVEELQSSLALEMWRAQELEEKLMANNEELEIRSVVSRESKEQNVEKDGQIQILENELDIKLKSIESMKNKVNVTEVRVVELSAELSKKTEEVQLFKLKVQELEGHLFTEKKKNKDETEQLRKEATNHKAKYEELLSNFDELQSEKMFIQQQFECGSSNAKATEESEEKAAKLTKEIQRLEEENVSLHEEVKSVNTRFQRKCQETETLEKKIEENCELLQDEVTEKQKLIKTVEAKNKMLKKQIAKEITKSSQLENVISDLQDESLSLKKQNEEDQQELLKDLENKSTFTAELENEVQKLKVTAAEAAKHKEEAELKCQQKIADMVVLMEKHKSQYERMVEEKDEELEDNKKRESGAVAQSKSLELDLLKLQTEKDELKKELKTEITKRENLQKELIDLKTEMSSMKFTLLSKATTKQSPASNRKQDGCSETPKESASKRHVFDFCSTRRTPSYSRDHGSAAVLKSVEPDTESLRSSFGTTPKKKDFHMDDSKPSKTLTYKVGGASKIKSYRIRTPPSDEKAARWKKTTIELDPKSDSSDHNDLLTFANESATVFSASHCKLDTFKKSPVTHKSPGNFLKLAAMKRMRDAGWTAVTSCDKKKKKNSEKIFA
ncbi:unnamed protein product [Pleuronectes platessa]|uniref:Synaptonemal complex protein 1 n=1 Tax=Pleuronectes platessa TaxID=8262 RepID=A0A9N7Z044_PLEPL|nr:unnamed protein product [Pleuronectes platessa]